MNLMPDTDGKWKTFALAPVAKAVMVHIAFNGPITNDAIKKAIRYLESALDWAPPQFERAPIEPEIMIDKETTAPTAQPDNAEGE